MGNGYPNDELYSIDSSRWQKDKKIELSYSVIEDFWKCARNFFDELIPLIETKNNERIVREDIDLIVNACQEVSSKKTEVEKNAIKVVLEKLHKI